VSTSKSKESLTSNRTGAYKQKLKELFPCRYIYCNTTWSSKYFLCVGQKARNDLFLKSLGILFQSLGPVSCIDLCVKYFLMKL